MHGDGDEADNTQQQPKNDLALKLANRTLR
jgi:hypothetical protein